MNLELTDGVIRLRPYTENDAQELFEAATESIDEAYPWLPWCHPGYTIKESLDYIRTCPDKLKSGTDYSFRIEDAATGRQLGGCGLNAVDKDNHRANLGYWVRTSSTRKGVATAATKLLARFGFEQLALLRIEIVAAVKNKPSQKVAKKVGAKKEGTIRNRLFLHGKTHDAVVYSLIPADFGL